MATFGGMVTSIRTDIDRGTSFDTRIKEAIVSAIDFYKSRKFAFNQKRTTFTVTQEYTSLTSDWLIVYSLEMANDELLTVNQSIITQNAGEVIGTPIYYAIQNRSLRVYPVPDRTYSFEMSYLFHLQDVSLSASDAATNSWTNDAYDLIKTHALIEVKEVYIGGPDAINEASLLRTREVQLESALKRLANAQQSTKGIRAVM